MTTSATTCVESRGERRPLPTLALERAAQAWFVVAALGQWTFVYFIAGFYVGPTVGGHFEAWNRKDLIKGYVAGDRVGNLFFAAHVLLAGVITTSGVLQLFPQIRSRALAFHRWNGRLYVLLAFAMALGGLWMLWVRRTYLAPVGAAGSTLLATLILLCAFLTLHLARARKVAAHRRWALRLFLVANGVWFQRIGYMFWTLLNGGPVGMTDHMDGPFDVVWGFGSFLLPLAVLEIYLRTKARGRPVSKSLLALALFAFAITTATGIVGAWLHMWRPYLV